ncbi:MULTISPECIES: DUF3999 family protein [unclassified Janthinobacterium]|uniref:DUF3999 family protein n=1 Tax=unclassified Janthinobacterium TaxID=2610881 RepID=UPI000885C9E8|nr:MULTISPECIES: DUF3999 family protein [unclassified Janthinobacterium]SDA42454.1 Protein of unknown function [Janthinobacterium sp. 551a]SFA89018.1 Protein of unknown function [Janthinobacterium sp. 344]
MKPLLICCSLLVAGAALAAPGQDRPQDYRWSIALTPQPGAGLSRLSVPTDVYLHARSASLADVRLFDSTGKPLAFALTAPPAQSRTQRDTLAMRIFPVTGKNIGYYELDNVDIRTGNDGRLLSVTTRGGGTPDAAPGLLILDAGPPAKDSRIGALHFTLPPGTDNYNAQVLLEVSDDLKQWDAIATTTLNWLRNSDTQTLANDRIEFAPRAFRYARLSWQYGDPITFAGIAAQQVSVTAVASPRATITLKGTAGKDVDERLYATPIAIPADSIGLQLAEGNTSMPVTLGVYHPASEAPRQRLHLGPRARATQAADFEPLLNTTFYRINMDGKERVSGDLAMPVVQTAQWVLRPQYHSGTNPNLNSVLRLGWTPASLVFLASGKGPYQLVFGRNGATPAALPLSQVAPGFTQEELLALPVATAARVVALTSEAPIEKTPDGAGLRLAALWAALLLGVGVLGFFAWRLLAQMKEEQGSTDKQEH